MSQPQTAEAIAQWAEDTAPADKPRYKRLTDVDRAFILRMRDKGLTQVQIAQRLGCAQSTISDVLDAFSDTLPEAKRYLRGQALKMARNIADNGRAQDHVAALKGLGVLQDAEQSGFTVMVGRGGTVNFAVQAQPTGEVIDAEVSPLRLGGDSSA
jgi:hypothetical protein